MRNAMIHVVVGTRHLSAILGYRFNAVLRRTLERLVGMPVRTVNTPDELAGLTVFEVLEDFHSRASVLLQAEPAVVMAAQRNEIMRVTREEHHYPDFEATIEDACQSVAIHGLFPHGTLPNHGTRVFLPEFSIGVRCFGFFGRSPSSTRATLHSQEFQESATFIRALDGSSLDEDAIREVINRLASLRERLAPPFAPYELLDEVAAFFTRPPRELQEMLDRLPRVPAMLEETVSRIEAHVRHEVDGTIEHLSINRPARDLLKVECHLCDTLRGVYDRADSYWNELRTAASSGHPADGVFFDHQFERTAGEDYLVIDAVAHGFQGHRSLRRDNPEVPTLGNHRLLAGKATRQGIGKPVVSGIFPVDLWRLLESPVQHFILNAAEQVGAEQCPPLYPNMPSEEEMHQLYWAAVRAEGDCGFETEDYSASLRRLGIEAAVQRRIAAYLDRLEGGEWAWDWTRAVFEYRSALYDDDVEQSLHLQDLLDLYALHKRVLGLVEYILVPRLISRGVGGNGSSALWTKAFTGWRDGTGALGRLSSASLPAQASDLATLETEGNWSLFSADHVTAARTGPIYLADLLDGIVARIASAREVAGVSLSLSPATPQVHAGQLAALADRSSHNAACMTLYFGKVALMLRNAVEHGTDRVLRDGLLVDTAHYWGQSRGGR